MGPRSGKVLEAASPRRIHVSTSENRSSGGEKTISRNLLLTITWYQ